MKKERQIEKALIKQDSNFLEYPTYVLQHTGYSKEIIIEKENGKYRLATSNPKLPDRLDRVLLYYVLEKIWKSNFKTEELKTTRYKIAKDVIGATGKSNYKRVMDGLKRWKDISVEFEGIFYEGDQRTTRYFGFLNDVILQEETKELIIRVNKQFLEQQQKTGYYRVINWRQFKNFSRDISARLYEIFQIRTFPWKIESESLIQKLTLSAKYPAHIMSKLVSAVNEINHKTGLYISVTHYKNPEGKTIFVFEQKQKKNVAITKRQQSIRFISDKPADKSNKEISTQPLNKKAQTLIDRGITESTAQTLVKDYPDNIIKQVDVFDWLKEKGDPRVAKNPAGYLRKSIEDNYASPEGYISKEQRLKIKEQQEKEKREYEKQRRKAIEQDAQKRDRVITEQKMDAKVNKFIASLSIDRQKTLKEQAKQEAKKQYGDFVGTQEIVINRKQKEIVVREYSLTPEKLEAM